ncbi:hypothetical protein ScPMuIL_000317 [Solemya velum]
MFWLPPFTGIHTGVLLLCNILCAEKTYGRIGLQADCQETVFINTSGAYSIDFKQVLKRNQSTSNTYCYIYLKTDPTHLIKVILQYSTGYASIENCSRGYFHIGNGIRRPDVEMVTSYKFCRSTIEEIISRDNFMWIAYRRPSLITDETSLVHIKAEYPVPCNSSMFDCSTVQCVDDIAICDGQQDCDNKRDEYCATPLVGEVIPNSTCFLCSDGHCIQPVLPRYYEGWGKEYWYLCDDYEHCPDGSDERKGKRSHFSDICYRIKSKSSGLFRCIPSTRRSDYNGPTLMWNDVVCDGVDDCLHGEDEELSLCQIQIADEQHTDAVAIVLVVVALVAVTIGSLCTFRLFRKAEKFANHAPTQSETSVDPEAQRLRNLDVISEEPELKISRV